MTPGFGEDGFTLDATVEEAEKAGSKFASPGLHLSEFGMPEWETPGQSIRFPFTIVEDGDDNGKEAKIVCGVGATALWKLKEVLKAAGVPFRDVNGKANFDHMAVVGKQFMSLWTLEKDSRTPEEGGKGVTYTKASGAHPVGTKQEDLGI